MRGMLTGLVTGLVVSGLVLGVASVVVDLADMAALRQHPPDAGAVEVPPGSGFDAVREDREAALPQVADTPAPAAAPRVPEPAPDDTRGLAPAETAPAPATGAPTSLAAPPEDTPGVGGVAVQSESPVLPSPQAPAPARPEDEARVSIATNPAQPPSPDPGESDAGLSRAVVGQGTETGDETARAAVPQTGQAAGADAAGADGGEAAGDAPQAADDGADKAASEPSNTPRRLVPESGAARPVGDAAVITDRLPRIGVVPPAEDTPGAQSGAQSGADATVEAAPEPQGALARNAVPVDLPQDKPLMAIVLIDDGQSGFGADALAAFPYPLSIAIPATRPDAKEAAARYHAAGFEVLLAADLPPEATPADVETAMAAWLDRVPQAAAVIEGDGSGLQSSRQASAQLGPILAETGHGLVMRPNGLDTARKLIARDGVPAVTLFRDLDAKGQGAAAVRRFLDNAAMRAAQQQEGVITVGRLRAETVSALLLWGLQDRAASVALVPVSAVLRQGAAGE